MSEIAETTDPTTPDNFPEEVYATARIGEDYAFVRLGEDRFLQFRRPHDGDDWPPPEEVTELALAMYRRSGGKWYAALDVTATYIRRLMDELTNQAAAWHLALSCLDTTLSPEDRLEFVADFEREFATTDHRLAEGVLYAAVPKAQDAPEEATGVEVPLDFGSLRELIGNDAPNVPNAVEFFAGWERFLPIIRRVDAAQQCLHGSDEGQSAIAVFTLRGVFRALVLGEDPTSLLDTDPFLRALPERHEQLALLRKRLVRVPAEA